MAGATLGAVDLTSLHPAVLSTRTSCVLMMSPLVRSTAIPVPSSKVNTSPANFSPVGVTPDTWCPIPQSAAPIVRYGSEGRWGAHRAGDARQDEPVDEPRLAGERLASLPVRADTSQITPCLQGISPKLRASAKFGIRRFFSIDMPTWK